MNNGGPAFPNEAFMGMSLRDWFAGQALFGFGGDLAAGQPLADIGRWAYEAADAMLAAREKEPQT